MHQNKPALSAGCWIGSGELTNGKVLYFKKDFMLKEMPEKAVLYCSGIGYQEPAVNGVRTSDGDFAPAFSDYSKTVYYTIDNIDSSLLKKGKNSLNVKVAEGWRNSFNDLTKGALGGRELTFSGPSQLLAVLEMTFFDGTEKKIATDSSWKVGFGPIDYSSIFDGETFDASKEEIAYKPCVKVPAPGGELLPMDIPNIKVIKSYPATELINRGGGVYVADFGFNIAGNAGLKIPAGMKKGDKIILRFAEELDEDGLLYMAPLRQAKCTDTYIASGKEDGSFIWRPSFTFHGFRYCDITTPVPISKSDITAYSIHTDIKNGSLFSCGSALVNKIQENIVRTEENNIFSILTDCPQRDERMGWLNDATVRFEETPYNFDISRIFPKIVRDINDCQGEDGSITCTAPFYFGSRPADPVCSSFLIAGYEAWLHTGNTDVLRENIDAFAAWEDCLLSHSDGYLVNYSYYGDWAAPYYACKDGIDGAVNAETDGCLVSSVYSYANCVLLTKMAAAIGRSDIEEKYSSLAEKIAEAFRAKWYNGETCTVANGSEGAQAFALRFGLIPEKDCHTAAKILNDDLISRNYHFTTGNLATVYMLDMLMAYGYEDTAWELLTREEYPSFGYMIQNEATTIWERLELKKNPGMNSHDHPMYGSVGKLFYSRICGVVPLEPGYAKVKIAPVMPTKLLSARCVIDTVKGDISVRWAKRYGKKYLFVSLPEDVEAEIDFCSESHSVKGGYHSFEAE